MGVVVERGSARCPLCVAVADYAFIESGLDTVRYEVHCQSCGQVYSEVNSLAPQPWPGERNLPMLPLPPEPRPPATWRRHFTPLGRAAGRLRARVRPARFADLVAAEPPTMSEFGTNG
jgi:hypothetical protein